MNQKRLKRRDFIKGAAMGTAALMIEPSRVLGANDRVRVGFIGFGGRAQELVTQLLPLPGAELVAVADIYTRRLDEAKHLAPTVRTFDDHRRLLDAKDVDAVIVA